jgi:hypothetical protein
VILSACFSNAAIGYCPRWRSGTSTSSPRKSRPAAARASTRAFRHWPSPNLLRTENPYRNTTFRCRMTARPRVPAQASARSCRGPTPSPSAARARCSPPGPRPLPGLFARLQLVRSSPRAPPAPRQTSCALAVRLAISCTAITLITDELRPRGAPVVSAAAARNHGTGFRV